MIDMRVGPDSVAVAEVVRRVLFHVHDVVHPALRRVDVPDGEAGAGQRLVEALVLAVLKVETGNTVGAVPPCLVHNRFVLNRRDVDVVQVGRYHRGCDKAGLVQAPCVRVGRAPRRVAARAPRAVRHQAPVARSPVMTSAVIQVGQADKVAHLVAHHRDAAQRRLAGFGDHGELGHVGDAVNNHAVVGLVAEVRESVRPEAVGVPVVRTIGPGMDHEAGRDVAVVVQVELLEVNEGIDLLHVVIGEVVAPR